MTLSFRNLEVETEFLRWMAEVDRGYNQAAPGLRIKDVLAIHFLIVDTFYGKREGLGGIGPKDLGLLSSAVSRQNSGFGEYEKWAFLEEKVATLLYGIVMNHPFRDANKRTAFLTTLYYLQREGLYPKITAIM